MAPILNDIREVTRFLTTTRVSINTLNWFVKNMECILDRGNGEIHIVIRNGKLYKKRAAFDEYENEESIDNSENGS